MVVLTTPHRSAVAQRVLGVRIQGLSRKPGRFGPFATAVALVGALGSPTAATSQPSDGEPAAKLSCQPTLAGVAHQDDDLLFLNPELEQTVRAGCPVSTIFLTAGDDGNDLNYVTSRENGARAAYAVMAQVPNRWTEHDLTVNDHRLASFTLDGREGVRLTFVRLPDGEPNGNGTPRYGQQSLLKLIRGQIPKIQPVDNASDRGYPEQELLGTLTSLINRSDAQRILTLDYDNTSFGYDAGGSADHSDHGIGARYFRKAAYQADRQPKVGPYLGYNMSPLPRNLTPQQTDDKTAVVNEYDRHEGCYQPDQSCQPQPLPGDYANWVTKQYPRAHRSPDGGEILSDIGSTNSSSAPAERCLDVKNGASGNGEVQTYACNRTSAQAWSFEGDTIRTRLDGRCLTASNGPTVAVCDGAANQRWTREPDGHLRSGDQCLYQADPVMPDARLTITSCAPNQPELTWHW